jgi:hypothetical protein
LKVGEKGPTRAANIEDAPTRAELPDELGFAREAQCTIASQLSFQLSSIFDVAGGEELIHLRQCWP